MTSPSTIYLATTIAAIADQQQPQSSHGPPLYENASKTGAAVGQEDDSAKSLTFPVDSRHDDEIGSKRRSSQTVCRSVSFLQKKSYHECFNSAFESQMNRINSEFSETAGELVATPTSPTMKATDGVEWEFQDLSLYLGS